MAGSFTGTIDLGGGPLTAISNRDGFLWHFDDKGNHVYARQYVGAPASGTINMKLVASDAAGAFYVTGFHNGLLDYGTGVLPGNGRFTFKVAP